MVRIVLAAVAITLLAAALPASAQGGGGCEQTATMDLVLAAV